MRVSLLLLVACAAKASALVAVAQPATAPTAETCADIQARSAAVLDDAYRRYGKLRSLSQNGDDKGLKLATEQFHRLALDYPWFSLAQRGLGIVYAFRGNWIASYSAYVRYLAFPVNASDRERVGGELRVLEDKQPALRGYAEAVRFQKDEPNRATEILRKVIGQKPQFALAHRTLGDSLSAEQKWIDATEAYEAYLQLEPLAPDRRQVEAFIERYRGHK